MGVSGSARGSRRSQSLARALRRPLAAPGARNPRSKSHAAAPEQPTERAASSAAAALAAAAASPGASSSGRPAPRAGAAAGPAASATSPKDAPSSRAVYTLLPPPSHLLPRRPTGLSRRSSADELRHRPLAHSPSRNGGSEGNSNISDDGEGKDSNGGSEGKSDGGEGQDVDYGEGSSGRSRGSDQTSRVRKVWNPETQAYENKFSSGSSSNLAHEVAYVSPGRAPEVPGLRRLSRSAQQGASTGRTIS
jgi:hypothetical protein